MFGTAKPGQGAVTAALRRPDRFPPRRVLTAPGYAASTSTATPAGVPPPSPPRPRRRQQGAPATSWSATPTQALPGQIRTWRCGSAPGDAWNQINGGAPNDTIRMATIEKADGRAPPPPTTRSRPSGNRPSRKDTVEDFSAACFYFARELQKTRKVPLGLVHASWGGSGIEGLAELRPLLRKVGGNWRRHRDPEPVDQGSRRRQPPLGRDHQGLVERQASHRGRRRPLDRRRPVDSGVPDGLGVWERWGVPALAEFNGVVWFETEVTLTAAQAKQASLTPTVGQCRRNGHHLCQRRRDRRDLEASVAGPIPSAGGRQRRSVGKNTIVVSAYDTYANGGMYGDPAARP
ncbi:hypothetical protein ACRAWD_28175 [Caulobacter segnis]